MLGRLAREVDLCQQLELAAPAAGTFIQSRRDSGIVDRMDDVESRAGLPGLVRLQMADEVPAKRQIGGPVHLFEGLLDLVFSEVDLARVGGGPDVVGGEGFGDGDEANRGGVAPGPAGGARDPIANASQPGTERGGFRHALRVALT